MKDILFQNDREEYIWLTSPVGSTKCVLSGGDADDGSGGRG